jgi:hypothetical protein
MISDRPATIALHAITAALQFRAVISRSRIDEIRVVQLKEN